MEHEMIETIGIIGAGTMGNGIAQICAAAGLQVTMIDISEAAVAKGMATVTGSLERLVNKQKMTDADRQAALARINATTDNSKLTNCDLVIEAATEREDLKIKILKDLCATLNPRAIVATNTSSIPITKLAASTDRPDRFIGMHFFNPVPLMKLVEVIRTITTSKETEERALDFVRWLDKEPIRAKDSSGFVVNLLLIPYMVDAIRALESNVASIEDIDKGMQLGAGHPMGPFTLLDFVGLDTVYKIAEIMFEEYRDSRYAPPPLLKRMVLAGMLGRKSGKGFYDYSTTPPRVSALGL